MIYALAGAHGAGKSTLAKAFAEATGMEYRPFTTSEHLAKAGLSLRDANDLPGRIRVQRVIVDAAWDFFRTRGTFITDRSPLDIAAYLMADVRNEPISEDDDATIQAMVDMCFDMTDRYVTAICLVYPSLPYVPRPDQPHVSQSYRLHHHHLIYGMAYDTKMSPKLLVIPPHNIELESRVKALAGVHHNIFMKQAMEERAVSTIN